MDAFTIVLLALAVLTLGTVGVSVLIDASVRRADVVHRASGGMSPGLGRGIRLALDRRLRRTRLGRHLTTRLRGAALDVTALDAILLVLALCVVEAVLLFSLMGVLGSIVLALFTVAGASRWLSYRVEQRIEAFVGQLPEVARVLSNAAAAGLALRSAIDLTGRELPDPAGAEFRTVAESLAVGQTLQQALDAMNDRLPSRELSVLVQTLVIQSRTGGALVTALQNIAMTLEQRKELRREVKTVVSGAVFGGYVVTALGVLAVFVMNLLSPGALDSLVGTGLGRIVLVAATALFTAGYVLINRITRIEV